MSSMKWQSPNVILDVTLMSAVFTIQSEFTVSVYFGDTSFTYLTNGYDFLRWHEMCFFDRADGERGYLKVTGGCWSQSPWRVSLP